MNIIFIRHGETEGNLFKRYIGITDEELCNLGIEKLKSNIYPECDIVISSPMKRCIQTAKIIYPKSRILIYNDLRECNFGDFENKNYKELADNQSYQKWIESNGKMPFPNGESHNDFKKRCVNAFKQAVNDNSEYENIAFIVHGGTIMSILEKYSIPKGDFYDFKIDNCSGYITKYSNKHINIVKCF